MDEYPYSENDFKLNTTHSSNHDFWQEDGISLTGNPNPSPDMIVLGSRLPGGMGDDHLTLNSMNTLNVKMNEPKNHLWKYNEDKILKDVEDYVTSTYGSHYCGHNQSYKDTQTIDLMAAKDLAVPFCQANILKYGSRYGDKDGRNKRDLLKVIHYAMLLLHFDGHYTRKDNGLSEFR
jgi:Protein of unknwon function (DUF3310)